MSAEKKGFAYTFAATVTTVGLIVLLLAVASSLHSPAIVLAATTLAITCVTFMITIPAILLSILRNSRRSVGYEIQKFGQGRALRPNLRADEALNYYVSFAEAIEALEAQYL
jgi:uncharacterized membrane protein YkgB